MREFISIIMAVVALIAVSGHSDGMTASDVSGTIRICALDYNPPGQEKPHDESITICNEGSREVDLRGWKVSDNHAEATLGRSIRIAPGQRTVISGKVFNPTNNTNKVALANSGDFVKLFNPLGILVDAVCWKKGCTKCTECHLLDEKR